MKKHLCLLILSVVMFGCSENKKSNNSETIKPQIWRIGDIVNDFDEPTGKHYISADFYGIFRNNATSGDLLGIRLIARNTTGIEYDYSIYLEFDEYCNGTLDIDYSDDPIYVKIVNKEARKVFKGQNFYDLKDKNGAHVTLENILTEEGLYTFEVAWKYNLEYQFIIDSKNINQALVDAKLAPKPDIN